jgi:hypothetical protein
MVSTLEAYPRNGPIGMVSYLMMASSSDSCKYPR